jgi:hypothetical protein
MSDSNLKVRLTNILECLIKYKKALINKYTLTSQKPSILNNLSPFLKQQCADITQYMLNREMPENPSKDLSECLDCLKLALDPWNSDLSILAPHLCEIVLVNSEMNLNVEKIIETYLPDPLTDGVPTDGPESKQEEEVG